MRTNATGTMELVVADRRDKNKEGEAEVLHEERREWILETRTFSVEKPPIVVTMSLGMTKNLGQFQFARMDLGVSIPCHPEELEKVYKRAKRWLASKIEREVMKIDKSFVEEGRLSS